MSEYKLTQEIIKLSNANNWVDAKKEWILDSVYESEDSETCLCGHSPIKEICSLSNIYNSNNTNVGNSCVKKFMCLDSDKIFKSIKKIRKDPTKSIGVEAIEYFHNKKIITDWEKGFYMDIKNKRKLTEKQFSHKKKINDKILSSF